MSSPSTSPGIPDDGAARRRLAWLLLPAAATVLGLVDASQLQYDRALRGDPITWDHALIHGIPRWYAWALLVPFVLLLARWAQRSVEGVWARVAVHLVAGLAVTFVQVSIFAVVSTLLHDSPDALAHLRPAFQKYIGLTYLGGLVTYALIVGGWYAWDVYRRYREREREAARLGVQASALKAHLAEARLRNLQSRLQPHFLFNALHALSGLVLEGRTRNAVRMTTRLSELLRRSLDLADSSEIPLAEELRLVEDYLAIQALRFDDRLQVAVEAEPGTLGAAVPPLILQPLVENAVRHGIEADPAAGEVTVRCRREGDELVLVVEDDGPGPAGSAPGTGARAGEGVGLASTRERLRALHGGAAGMTLEERGDRRGARVTARMPFRRMDPDERPRGEDPAAVVSGEASDGGAA